MSVGTTRIIKAPQGLTKTDFKIGSLKMKGISVIDFCFDAEATTGTMFLKDHLLLIVLQGVYTIRYGDQVYKVRSNEMMFLQKSIAIEFEKSGELDSGDGLNGLMFFLKEEILDDFIKLGDIKPTYPESPVPVSVNPVNTCILEYVESLEPYFDNPDEIVEGLVKVKVMELLFHVIDANEQISSQLLQPKRKEWNNIDKVVEENLMNPVSLHDLAYLSGRSLSTFKRDFQVMYNTSPIKWIRNRRLDKAKELLTNTSLSVTDVCFSTGFENAAHFSKVFKDRFGFPPSELKKGSGLKRTM
ncbi:AraC family transcriptional regulator [Brevibacillus brevis X23]|nr:AraC family transcriptional regulator [Brevibacillus brevis X23]